jgi:hypothetical protein
VSERWPSKPGKLEQLDEDEELEEELPVDEVEEEEEVD